MEQIEILVGELRLKSEQNEQYIREIREGQKAFKDEIRDDIADIKEENRSAAKDRETLIKMACALETLAKQMTEIKADVKDVKRSQDDLTKRVDDVESAPHKKRSKLIDGIIEKIVWLVVGGLAAVAVGQMFPFVK